MSRADRRKWDSIYRERGRASTEPAALLVRFAGELPVRGRALDFGGGSGRNGVWLAGRGLDVTVADISPVGLDLTRAAGRDIATVEIDLELEPAPPGPWDLIIDFHFLHRPLFAALSGLLAPGGLFVFAQPTAANLERHPKPGRRFLLDDGEAASLVPAGLEIVHLAEGWTVEGRHEAEIVLRKPR